MDVDVDLLLDLIFENKILWKQVPSNNENKYLKRKSWQNIAKRCDSTVNECIRSWQTLRRNYNIERRSKNASYEETWPFNKMLFLKSRNFKSNKNANRNKLNVEQEQECRTEQKANMDDKHNIEILEVNEQRKGRQEDIIMDEESATKASSDDTRSTEILISEKKLQGPASKITLRIPASASISSSTSTVPMHRSGTNSPSLAIPSKSPNRYSRKLRNYCDEQVNEVNGSRKEAAIDSDSSEPPEAHFQMVGKYVTSVLTKMKPDDAALLESKILQAILNVQGYQ